MEKAGLHGRTRHLVTLARRKSSALPTFPCESVLKFSHPQPYKFFTKSWEISVQILYSVNEFTER